MRGNVTRILHWRPVKKPRMCTKKYAILALFVLANCYNYGILDKMKDPGSSQESFTTNYYVFVSSWQTLGAMGGSPYADCNQYMGMPRADCACTRAAISRGLRKSSSHVFRAWLSVDNSPGPQQDAQCRVQGTGGGCNINYPSFWYNTQGQAVVSNYNAFSSAALNTGVRYDEFRVDQGTSPVWTNTQSGISSSANDCNDWTDQSSGTGVVGDASSAGTTWSQNTTQQCNTAQRIYCVAAP